MPFLFLVAGVTMLVSAVRGTTGDLTALIKGDFTGKGNFIYWIAAIGFLGALGYIGSLRSVSRYMMALVLLVLFLKNGGVFQQFKSAIDSVSTTGASGTTGNGETGPLSALPPLFQNGQQATPSTGTFDPSIFM